jgi:hypothetical protein
MSRCRFTIPAVSVAIAFPLAAQFPQQRIQTGFKTLSTGNWESALKEWSRDGIWADADGKLKTKLDGLIPGPRSVGHWDSVNLPYLTATWQRHWMMATFDQGAMFFVFDFVLHKNQWRLHALQATQDPSEALPHLDLLPGTLAPRKSE